MKRQAGHYENLGSLAHFIPAPLPPKEPLLVLSPELMELYGQALQQLGQLGEVAQHVPDTKRFIKAYVIKEALLSSAIEGIHTTLIDVYTSPITETKPNKETQLVLNYTKALETALAMIQEENLPISSRVILNAHEALLSSGEGEKANPGNYRKQAVRVGMLVPPPAPQVAPLMSELEKFINTDNSLPPLIKAGLAHVQFETIHPFLDGNGRIGRLLIVLMLIESKILASPIIYPSYYFKKHHAEYYQRLDGVRLDGDFEGWIMYYLKAIVASSRDAYRRAKEIEALEQELKQKIADNNRLKNLQDQAKQALSVIFQFPVINIAQLATTLGKSYNSASSLIKQFVEMGIIQEAEKQKRNKLFYFTPYLLLLDKEYREE